MAELHINVTTDGEGKINSLSQSLKQTTDAAAKASETIKLIEQAAQGNKLHFYTTKARDEFVSLISACVDLENKLKDPSLSGRQVQTMTANLNAMRETVTEMTRMFSLSGQVVEGKFGKAISNTKGDIQQLRQQIKALKDEEATLLTRISSRRAVVPAKLQSKDAELLGLQQSLADNRSRQSGYSKSLDDAQKSLSRLTETESLFGRQSVAVAGQTDELIGRLNRIPIVGQATTGVFSQMKWAFNDLNMSLIGGAGLEQLGVRIFNTRSQFQQLEISFQTMLQSSDKAKTLMDQLVVTAAKTPFSMSSITEGAKQLLAYGTDAKEVNGIITHLGDIAAGLNIPLSQLVYLYGTTMAQGRMFTMDLRQFMGRGIPMAEELGKILHQMDPKKYKTGAMSEVQQAVAKGVVTSDMVKEAIINMTKEGGRFGGLMEKQSKTLQGRWSNIGDTVDQMFNEIGKKTEGIFGKGLDFISYMIGHWQTLLHVILSAVAAVGTYKTGVMLAAKAQQVHDKFVENGAVSPIQEQIRALRSRERVANRAVGYNVAQKATDDAKTALGQHAADLSYDEDTLKQELRRAEANKTITAEYSDRLLKEREELKVQSELTAQAEQQAGIVHNDSGESLTKGQRIENELRDKKRDLQSQLEDLDSQIADKQKIYDEKVKAGKGNETIAQRNRDNRQFTDVTEEFANYRNAYNERNAATRANESANLDVYAAQRAYDEQKARTEIARKQLIENPSPFEEATAKKRMAEYEAEKQKLSELEVKLNEAKATQTATANAVSEAVDKERIAYDKLKESSKVDGTRGNLESAQAQYDMDMRDVDAQREKLELIQQQNEERKKQLDDKIAEAENNGGFTSDYEDVNDLRQQRAELDNSEQNGEGSQSRIIAEANAQAAQSYEDLVNARKEFTDAQSEGEGVDSNVADIVDALSVANEEGVESNDNLTEAVKNGTVTVGENSSIEKLNADSKTMSANASNLKANKQDIETLAEKRNAVQTELNTTQERLNTVSKKENNAQGILATLNDYRLAASHGIATAATTMFSAATHELTAAWAAFKMELLTNPFTAIITVIMTLVTMIPLVKDLFGLGDDAEEDSQKYTNAANDEIAKTNELVATLKSTATNTKAHSDAMADLTQMYQQYGIQLDDTIMKGDNEAAKTQELIKHHNDLSDALKNEAVQQQYLNDVKAAGDKYDSDTEDHQKDLDDSLKDKYFAKEEKAGFHNLVSKDDIEALRKQKQVIDDMQKSIGSSHMSIQRYWEAMSQLRAETNKYNNLKNRMLGTTKAYTENLMKEKGQTKDLDGAVKNATDAMGDYIDSQLESATAAHNSQIAADRARNAYSNLGTTAQMQAEKNRLMKMSFKDLRGEMDNIIMLCRNKYNFNIKVNWDDSSLPGWVKKMSSSQLKASLAARQAWLKSHKNGDVAIINGQYKSYQQMATEASAMSFRTNDFEPKNTPAATTKKTKSKGSGASEANAAKNRENARMNAEKEYNEKLRKFFEDSEQSLTDAKIKAMKDGAEKEVAEINNNADKQLKAIEAKEKALADARKKLAATIWKNSSTGKAKRTDADFNKTEEGKRSDEEWIKQVRNEKDKKTGKTVGEELDAQRKAIQESRVRNTFDVVGKTYKSAIDQRMESMEKFYSDMAEIDKLMEFARNNGLTDKLGELQRAKEVGTEQFNQEQSKQAFNEISAGIDWGSLFNGIGNLSTEMMKPMLEQLKAFTKSDQYKNADSQTQKDVLSMIKELEQRVGTEPVDMNDFARAMRDFTTELSKYEQAKDLEAEGKRDYENALSMVNMDNKDRETIENEHNNGTISDEEYNRRIAENAKNLKADTEQLKNAKTAYMAYMQATSDAQKKVEQFGDKINTMTDDMSNWSSDFSRSLSNSISFRNVEGFGELTNSIKNFDTLHNDITQWIAQQPNQNSQRVSIATNISSGIEKGMSFFNKGFSGILSGVVGFVTQIPQLILNLASMIKNFVTGILNSFTKLLKFNWLEDLVNSILEAVGNFINAIFDLPENIYKVISSIVVKGVGGLVNTILGRVGNVLTWGALSSKGPAEWFTRSNAKEVADRIEELTDSNKLLQTSIDDLTSQMKNAVGATAIDITGQKQDLLKQTTQNYLDIAKAQGSYHGSHHSFNSKWGGFTDEEIERLKMQFAAQLGSDETTNPAWNGDLWSLTPEQMKILRSNVDLWKKIEDTGKGGYGERVAEKLNDYINQAGKAKEATEELYKTLTGTTADDAFSDFLSHLKKMASGSQDVFSDISDSWQEMVNNMVINDIVGAKFQDNIKSWYKKVAELSEKRTKGTINDYEYQKELNKLKEEYNGYASDAQKDIQNYRDMGIVKDTGDYSQSASSGTFQTMSQDVGTELNGRFTAVQTATEGIWKQVMTFGTQHAQIISIADEGRTILSQQLIELQAINERQSGWERPLKTMWTQIKDIRDDIHNKL
jgi:ribosomal protein L30E